MEPQRASPRRRPTTLAALSAMALLSSACAATPKPPTVARPLKDATARFAVIGDYGTVDASERAVAAQVKRWVDRAGADALVTTGDNAYPASTPDSLEAAWGLAYGWVGTTKVIATLGNHDVEADGGASTIDYFDLPAPWYQTSISDVDFFVLDANRPEDPDQTSWLRAALGRSEVDWKVVVFHQPAFSCSKHGGDPRIVERWVPLFAEFDVDLVLSGHDHNYQRFVSDGTTYVVTGGGGASLYGLEDCGSGIPQRVMANDEQHHFLGIEASRREMRIQAIGVEGEILDTFSLEADP